MNDMKIFVPMTKIDTAQRLVYGVVTAEQPDGSGEICDYASTKPLYQKWSQGFAEATDGRSLGNLRAMHGAVAAGKVVDIAFNDGARQIEICGKVVDDAEWQKVEEGVYTGFSQGGRYLKRWPDPVAPTLTRYTADPMEISLVDHPCLPGATWSRRTARWSCANSRRQAVTPRHARKRSARSARAMRRSTRIASDKSTISSWRSIRIAAPARTFPAPMSRRARNFRPRPASMATATLTTSMMLASSPRPWIATNSRWERFCRR
jgi:hypothetical protein